MNTHMSLNGTALGLASSKCFVLEQTIDCKTAPLNAGIPVEYPEEGEKYLLFGRGTSTDCFGCIAYVLNGRVYWGYSGWVTPPEAAAYNYKIYVYREIKDKDKTAGTYGLNIYNDNGSLFYSSDKLPLRIKGLRYFSDDEIWNMIPPLKTYNDSGCMVLLNAMATPKGGFLRLVVTPAINAFGQLQVGRAAVSHAGGDINRVFNNYVVVAYAPDLYPRHS